MSLTRSELSVTAAARLAPKLRLRSVVFTKIVAEHLSSRGVGKLRFDVPETLATWLRIERQVRAVFPFVVDITAGAPKDGGTPLGRIAVTIRLDYELDESIELPPGDELADYVGISGYMHAWPYFRAEVQALSSKIGFPTLVLPIVVSGHAATRVRVKEVQPGPSLVAESKSRAKAPARLPEAPTRRRGR